ncbi:dTMP kinase (plasmid) [Ahniella affigens]|uniref:Thymidylate kinase n=1 Tax=Ahniella affigens TaxID=2021234 RepID=A0A2P1PZK6_9GAMM|nr:dTMP kinase [Ahniella affigens]AVQ00279.1 dTMP kinase [Ahniella affigens]
MTGRLVVVEGIDGSGKTELIRALGNLPRSLFTREPTLGPYGKALREAFGRGERLSREAERALIEADRRQHVELVISPALARGEIVVCDRSFYSTAAYQGLSVEDARSIVRDNMQFAPRPDVLVFLDLPPVFALARIQARGEKPTAPESYETLVACAARYESVWADPELMRGITFIRIDAREPLDIVTAAARRAVDSALQRS